MTNSQERINELNMSAAVKRHRQAVREGVYKGIPKRKQPAGLPAAWDIRRIRYLHDELQFLGHPDFQDKEHKFQHLKNYFSNVIFCLQSEFRWNILSTCERESYLIELQLILMTWTVEFCCDTWVKQSACAIAKDCDVTGR